MLALFGLTNCSTASQMKDFFSYLTVGEEDKDWGLFLHVAGKAKTLPHTLYPSKDHPTGYFFNWDHGRVLQEFQLIYITEGKGVFENESGKYPIYPGVVMLIRPGVKHRYKPDPKTGWAENYIGFSGEYAPKFLSHPYLNTSPVIACGIREELIDTYHKIFDLVKEEKPGFQHVVSGLIIKLLGFLVSFHKRRNISGKHIEQVIQKVRFQMREQLDLKIYLPEVAEEHNISYAYLRKMFKTYTGVSPHQYYLELKILRAREMILSSDKSIKEICYELGFTSMSYFSRLFKQKTGVNPSALREGPELFG